MLHTPARVVLFFSSYAPLSLIFLVLYVGRSPAIMLLAALAIVIGLGGLVWIIYRSGRDVAPTPAHVVACRKPGDEVMGYVATYLIPFVGFSLLDARQGIALALFLGVLAYLYATTDMIHINPTLHMFGYRMYEVTVEPDVVRHVITRSALRRGDMLRLVPLSGDLLIEKGQK